jgi:two-component system sensor histidine kinase KdpD
VTIIPAEADGDRTAADPGWPEIGQLDKIDFRLLARAAIGSGRPAGLGSRAYADADALAVPLRGTNEPTGVVLICPDRPEDLDAEVPQRIVEALAGQTAVALERALATERQERARIALETEQLRTALLSSLSHDLRSPLSSIEGAASSLVEDGDGLTASVRHELSETILEESRRMHRMVANLLDMVRVESGTLAVQKTWQPLEEVIGVALLRLDHRLAAHPVSVELEPGLPLVPLDEILIEQVFVNLLENAVKYTPPGTPITIRAAAVPGAVEVRVVDQGPAVPAGEEEAVIGRFYRARSTDEPSGGAGLGLTICRGIITAHGGRIWIEPGRGTGTAVHFTLPVEGPPPVAVSEAGAASAPR